MTPSWYLAAPEGQARFEVSSPLQLSASLVHPGDTLTGTVTYKNRGKKSVTPVTR